MLEFKKEGKYSIVATKYNKEDLSVNIGFTGKFPPGNLFLINKIKHREENNEIFKTLFMYFLSNNRTENFYDFFSLNENFYMVFKYKEEQNLNYRYNKKICVTDFRKRVKIFEDICIKIRNHIINRSPMPIIMSMLEPQNITVSSQDEVFINFDLRSIHEYESKRAEYEFDKNKYVIILISNIFKQIFASEMSSKYNRIINLIYQKCHLGIYKSIEALVSELKNNIEEAEISSLIEYIKYQFNIRKYLIPKITKIVFVPGLVAAFAFLIYQKLNGSNKGYNSQSLTIGNITYSGDSNDESSKDVNIDSTSKLKLDSTIVNKTIYIPPEAEIDFEDHIVKKGETPSSIAESQYSDKSLGSAITSFNDIKGNLIPGLILRVPTESVVDSYKSTSVSSIE